MGMKFGTDICGYQTIKPCDVGDFLTFPPALPAGQSIHFSCEMQTLKEKTE